MIYFREVKEPHFDALDQFNRYWHVEYYEDMNESSSLGRRGTPIGTAYVLEILHIGAQLNFVFVVDHKRRKGIATELIQAVLKRWPEVSPVGYIDTKAEQLLRTAGIPVEWRSEDQNMD